MHPQMPNRLVTVALLLFAVFSPLAIPALADVIQPGVIGPSGGRANPVYRRFWTETPGTRGGTFGEPLLYEADGGVVDGGVPVSDGGGFEPVAGASMRSPSAIITQDFCFTVEGSDLPDDVPGSSWQYGLNDDPVFWQIGEPGGINSAYLAPTHDGVLYLEVCDSAGEWSAYSTMTDTLTWTDATVTACRAQDGSWKLYVNDASGQPIEQPTVTDGTGTGVWSALGQDLVMGAGPGFGWRCTCGDGLVDCLETCDDGATAANDGCSATCTIDSGWQCSGEPSYCTLPCGNGTEDGVEECDDGNATLADGCSLCLVDSGYQCTGWPSVCVTTCGDGITAGTEQCDDGNVVDGDGCDSACVNEVVLGMWSAFAASDYFTTMATDDIGDATLNENNYTMCYGFSVNTPMTQQQTMTSNGYYTTSDGGYYIWAKLGDPSYLSIYKDMGSVVATSSITPPSTGAICFGYDNGVAKYDSDTIEPTVSVADNIASLPNRNRPWRLGVYYDQTNPFVSGSIGAVFASTSGATDALMASQINAFKDTGKFNSDANATVLCNGEQLGGTCSVGGNVFSKIGAPVFTPRNIVCGDGYVNGSETCDDGNTVAGDGCSATCVEETVLGTWGNFSASNYFTTPNASDVGDSTINASNYMICHGLDYPGASQISNEVPASNGTSVSNSNGFYLKHLTTTSTKLGSNTSNITVAPTITFPTRMAICFGRDNGTGRFDSNFTTPNVSTAIPTAGSTANPWLLGLYPGLIMPLTSGGVSAVFATTSSSSISSMATQINNFVTKGKFFPDVNTTVLCNGAQIGGTCAVGGSVFNKIGTVVFTPFSQVCGDGYRSGTEECDDGNTVAGDGCSTTCTVEEI